MVINNLKAALERNFDTEETNLMRFGV